MNHDLRFCKILLWKLYADSGYIFSYASLVGIYRIKAKNLFKLQEHLSYNLICTSICKIIKPKPKITQPLYKGTSRNSFLRLSCSTAQVFNISNNFMIVHWGLSYVTFLKELTHFVPLISFDTPWKHQKTSGFLMFSGGITRDQWHEMG